MTILTSYPALSFRREGIWGVRVSSCKGHAYVNIKIHPRRTSSITTTKAKISTFISHAKTLESMSIQIQAR
jgi:hypothetical protein